MLRIITSKKIGQIAMITESERNKWGLSEQYKA
jgi:hypothetical protein